MRFEFRRLKYQIEKLPGDMLLIACFISYVGSFTNQYRIELQENIWKPTIRDLKVDLYFNKSYIYYFVLNSKFQLIYRISPRFHTLKASIN